MSDVRHDGIRAMQMRGGTSKGLYFLADDLPADPAERDDLLLRVMGAPDPRQIDGVGGAHPLTSKVAVVAPSALPGVDVDYLFLQVMVDQPIVTDKQNCGNILAGIGPFAVERGLVPAGGDQTSMRIRMVNTDGIVTATFPTPGGRPATTATPRSTACRARRRLSCSTSRRHPPKVMAAPGPACSRRGTSPTSSAAFR